MNITISPKMKLIGKALVVGFLCLLMLIPLAFISELITDRQNLAREMALDVGNSWSNEQYVVGPVISFPAVKKQSDDKPITEWTHLLPNKLDVNAELQHKELKRGIYQAIVYNSIIKLAGEFSVPVDYLTSERAFYAGDASVTFAIADMRGVEKQVYITLGGSQLEMSSGLNGNWGTQGVTVKIPASLFAETKPDETGMFVIPFSMELFLRGSGGISFVPIGKENSVSLTADYPSPSFVGQFLPAERDITDESFSASWEVTHLNRNYGQEITGDGWYYTVSNSSFGVNLIDTISQYRQASRSVKYALLIIVLTFVVVFFADSRSGQKINVFQYLLSGFALVLFYSLLVSLSEYIAFALAYLTAAVMTTAMLTIYIYSILKSKRAALYVSLLLTGIYVFIYILLQMESFALLVGTFGLFVILAAVMWASIHYKATAD